LAYDTQKGVTAQLYVCEIKVWSCVVGFRMSAGRLFLTRGLAALKARSPRHSRVSYEEQLSG